MENLKNDLIKRIDRAIEDKARNTGCPENVSVTIAVTDEERMAFADIDKYDGDFWRWEFEGNELTVAYNEMNHK